MSILNRIILNADFFKQPNYDSTSNQSNLLIKSITAFHFITIMNTIWRRDKREV